MLAAVRLQRFTAVQAVEPVTPGPLKRTVVLGALRGMRT